MLYKITWWSMQTKDFEKQLQEEVDGEITIRTNPNHSDIAGVYWKNFYLGVAVPPTEIRDKHDEGYRDSIGYPYKTKQVALDLVKGQFKKFKDAMRDDPSLFVDEKK